MKVVMHTGGIAATNCFLVADEATRKAVLFDAPDHTVSPLLQYARDQRWDVIGLWLTHGHFDHIADHQIVTEEFPTAKVLIHPLDEPKLTQPAVQTRMFELPFSIPARTPDAHVTDGQRLALGGSEFEVVHTPGHSPGHVMYYCAAEDILVGGDLIIMNAIGRTDLPDSDHLALEASIRRVMKLPSQTRLLPGHGDESTLGEEMRTNSYVREAMRAAGNESLR